MNFKRPIKIVFNLILLFTAILFSATNASASDGHEIKLRIVGLHDTIIYFGNHFGDKQYVSDTVKVDHNGNVVVKGKDNLEGGIYLIVMPNKTYFEIVVNEQKFSIETDTSDFYGKMKVTGSQDNTIFRDYQVFMSNSSKKIAELRTRLDKNKVKADSTAAIKEQINALDKEVKDYRLKLMDDYNPKLFFPTVIRAISEPEIPEAPKNPDGSKDSTFAFKYFKAHFWDKVDFCDPRLLRTPVLYNKIKQYITNLTVQDPDSIDISVDTIIERSKCNKEVFKYCVAWLTNNYETSPIMGFDKIFVHLAEKYYLTDEAYWADSTLKAKIKERVEKITPNILGTPAYNLLMQDTNYVTRPLYDVKAKYTVLIFWDPTCSHCKVEVPKLALLYDSIKTKGVEVYGVGIESDLEEWKKFIREKKLKWINVTDIYNKTKFRDFYDIYSTPVIFLLDENKKIIAKRLDVDTLRDFLKRLLNEKKK